MSKNDKVAEEISELEKEVESLRNKSHSVVMLTTVEDWLRRIKKVNK